MPTPTPDLDPSERDAGKPWAAFAASLASAEAQMQARQRPCKVRMRWEVYDHTTQRYQLLQGSTFSFVVHRAAPTHLAERIWRAIHVLLG